MADVRADVVSDSPGTTDFGATVTMVLGTPAVIVLAKGLAGWLRKQGDPALVIKTKKGEVRVKGGLEPEVTRI